MSARFSPLLVALFACSSNAQGVDASADASSPDAIVDSGTDGSLMDQAAPCAPNMDFSKDPLNCGSCGKSCLGGACTAGKCGPLDIGSDLVERLAADTTGVYWAYQGTQNNNYTDGAVRGVAPTSTAPTNVFSGSSPVDVSVDGIKVYFVTMGVWANSTFTGGSAYSCPNSGCNGMPTPLGPSGDGFSASSLIANNTANVYWTNRSSNKTMTVPKSGGSAAIVSSGIGAWLSVTDTNLYMSYYDQVNRVALPMGTLTTIGLAAGGITGMNIGANALFWFARNNMGTGGAIQMCPLPDCSGGPQTLYNSDDGFLQALAEQNDTLYFSERGGITACKIASCATTKVTILPQPMTLTRTFALATVSSILYYAWGASGTFHISRLVL